MKKLIILLFAFVILSQLVEAQRLSITPTMIKETITIDRISNRTLKIENLEDYDVFITSVEISGEIKDIVSVTRKTTYLIPNGNGTMEIKIDTNNSTTGYYSGIINVSVNGNSTPVYVDITIIAPPESVVDVPDLGSFFETIFPIGDIQNNSYIIWYFAIGIVVVITIITILKYRKRRKKKKEEKEEKKGEVEEIYYKPQEEYRTEYY